MAISVSVPCRFFNPGRTFRLAFLILIQKLFNLQQTLKNQSSMAFKINKIYDKRTHNKTSFTYFLKQRNKNLILRSLFRLYSIIHRPW